MRNNPGFARNAQHGGAGSMPGGGVRQATPTGQNGRLSRGRGMTASMNAPYATNTNRAAYHGAQGGPKIATTNTRLQRF